MLRKRLKYDMKSLSRILLIVHAFLIIISLLGGLLIPFDTFAQSEDGQIWIIFIFIFFTMLISVISFATQLIVAIDFYKSMFSNQGYLTRTLPVAHETTFLSKVIAGTLWCLIDIVIVIGSLIAVFAAPQMMQTYGITYQDLFQLFNEQFGANLTSLLLQLTVTTLVSTVSGVLFIYLAICIGQTFTNHKIIGSVAVYFGLTTIISILTAIAMTPLTMSTTREAINGNELTIISPFALMDNLNLILILSSLVLAIVAYILCLYFIKKKTDL